MPSAELRSSTRLLPQAPPSTVDVGQRTLLGAQSRQLRQDIKARLGTDIPGSLTIVFDRRNSFDSAGEPIAGMADARFTGGAYTGCFLHLYPATFEAGSDVVTTLAHEMVHCFQAALVPNETAWWVAPGWVIEGSAEWASSTLVGPDKLEGDLWPRYLGSPSTPLFKRAYDAIGFYAHLEETGHSPWAAFRDMWSVQGNAAAIRGSGRHQRRLPRQLGVEPHSPPRPRRGVGHDRSGHHL